MRTQWCREHIDQTVVECGLSEETLREVKAANKLCDEHPEISGLSTLALRPLIRERDGAVRAKAISSVKAVLLKNKRITGKKVKAIVTAIREETLPVHQPSAGELITVKEREIAKLEKTLVIKRKELETLKLLIDVVTTEAGVSESILIPEAITSDETDAPKPRNTTEPKVTGIAAARAKIAGKTHVQVTAAEVPRCLA